MPVQLYYTLKYISFGETARVRFVPLWGSTQYMITSNIDALSNILY